MSHLYVNALSVVANAVVAINITASSATSAKYLEFIRFYWESACFKSWSAHNGTYSGQASSNCLPLIHEV
jgi:hypothetical protein